MNDKIDNILKTHDLEHFTGEQWILLQIGRGT